MKFLSRLFNRTRPQLISERIPSATYAQLPKEISSKLKAAARRVRRIVLVRGLCATIAVFTVAILIVMAVDAMVVIFSPFVHWGLWLAVVAATVVTAWRTIVQPLSIPLTPARIAALVEANHPELEERLSSVVELLGMGQELKASARLMEVLAQDAVTDVRKVSVRKDFSARTVKPRFLAALIAISIVALLVLAFPRAMSRLIIRAVIPTAEVDNVYADALKVTPGDAVILQGTPFTVQLAVESGYPSRAYVRTRGMESRSETAERMTQTSAEGGGGPTYYSFSYPLVQKSFAYRVHCGSALTREFKVKALAAPAYTNLEVKLRYPAYTKREPEVVREQKPAPISTVAGTKIEISAEPNRTDLREELLLPGDRAIEPSSEGDGRFTFKFDLEDMRGQWGIQLSDDYGFSNQVEFASIEVVKDAAPEIKLLAPKTLAMELPTFGAIPFEYRITDDFGFSCVRVEITGENGQYEEAMSLEPAETERRVWTGAGTIELSKFNLDKRRAVRFRLAAADNYPEELGGPHVSYSEDMSVRIAQDATSLAGKALSEQIKNANLTVTEVVKKLTAAKKDAGVAIRGFGLGDTNAGMHNKGFESLDAAKKDLLEGEKMLGDLVKELDSTMLTAGGDILEKALDDYLVPTRRFCEDIYLLQGDDKEKAAKTEELEKKIQETIDALTKAQKDFDKAAEDAKDLQKLAELAAREKALAEMAEKGEIDPEQFAKMQKALLDEFNKEFEDKLKDPLQKEKDQVSALKEKGEDLKKQQEELQKDAAALKGDDPEAKAEAEKDLREKTKSMPSETSAEDRLAELEDRIAEDIDKLAKEADKMSDEFDRKNARNAENADSPENAEKAGKEASENAREASQSAQDAAKDAKEAADALKDGNQESANENMDQVKENLDRTGEKLDETMSSLDQQSEAMQGDVSDYRDAQSDMQAATEAAEQAAQEAAEAAQNAEGNPENWDGQKDPNAEVPDSGMDDGQRDPNQQWDGQKDPNAEVPDSGMDDGQRDPNQQWDGQKDPNAEVPDSG
ncbi:MAG: hypothetical protein IIZ70_00290, partial [Kiritimatiellae bacterium]|nr:hypothetical protein [Kiritimatiellia bacterium]